MEKSTLQTLLEDTDQEVRSYSGRGMYGKECLGVVTDNVGELFADVLEELAGTMDDEHDLCDVAHDFRCMATDSMGMRTIVYFPRVPFVEDTEDDDCEPDVDEAQEWADFDPDC